MVENSKKLLEKSGYDKKMIETEENLWKMEKIGGKL